MIDQLVKKNDSARLSKGERTREKILRSAVQSLAHLGYERTTFQSIADDCGISQPLVVHYFKRKENVFPFVIEYLTSRTRDVIQAELDRSCAPARRLRDFVRVSISYARKEPEEAKIFLTLSYLAAFDDKYRHSNAEIKSVAVHELIDILVAGVRGGSFHVDELPLTAKLIASYIMGVRMNLLNEKPSFSDDSIIQTAEKHCLMIVNYRGDP